MKKAFHKDLKFLGAYSLLFKKKKMQMSIGHEAMRDSPDACTWTWNALWREMETFHTWLNAHRSFFPLFFYLLEILPCDVPPPGWRKTNLCETKVYYTRSHFTTVLKQVAEGQTPLNSLGSYCLLWTLMGHHQTIFYEDSQATHSLVSIWWKSTSELCAQIWLNPV